MASQLGINKEKRMGLWVPCLGEPYPDEPTLASVVVISSDILSPI